MCCVCSKNVCVCARARARACVRVRMHASVRVCVGGARSRACVRDLRKINVVWIIISIFDGYHLQTIF